MSTIYRNLKSNRLVHLYHRTPRMHTGGWVEEQDIQTGEVKKVSVGAEVILGTRDVKLDPKYYTAFAAG